MSASTSSSASPSTAPRHATRATRWLVLAIGVDLAAAVIGFVLGMGFAHRAGAGLGMGVVVGVNAALFCTLVADWSMTRLARRGSAQLGR